MNTVIIITALMITGIILLIIEALIVPGFSLPGLAGIAMLGYSIYKAASSYGVLGAVITIGINLIVSVIIIRFSIKTRTIKKIALEYTEKAAKSNDDFTRLIGKEGRSLTPLRPAGTAIIDGSRYDVVTEGDYIPDNTIIRVLEVEGSRVIVIHAERS